MAADRASGIPHPRNHTRPSTTLTTQKNHATGLTPLFREKTAERNSNLKIYKSATGGSHSILLNERLDTIESPQFFEFFSENEEVGRYSTSIRTKARTRRQTKNVNSIRSDVTNPQLITLLIILPRGSDKEGWQLLRQGCERNVLSSFGG